MNPEDVENAVWHFLCVARLSGVEKCALSLIPILHDDESRVPMMQIFALFGGTATEQTVMDAVNAWGPWREGTLNERLFYAHLYLGLYDEANGKLRISEGTHSAGGGKVCGGGLYGRRGARALMVLKIPEMTRKRDILFSHR